MKSPSGKRYSLWHHIALCSDRWLTRPHPPSYSQWYLAAIEVYVAVPLYNMQGLEWTFALSSVSTALQPLHQILKSCRRWHIRTTLCARRHSGALGSPNGRTLPMIWRQNIPCCHLKCFWTDTSYVVQKLEELRTHRTSPLSTTNKWSISWQQLREASWILSYCHHVYSGSPDRSR